MPKKEIDKELGLFFKKARTDQKLTYDEAAELSGISSRYLKAIENNGNVPSFPKIKQLVCALNVSPLLFIAKVKYIKLQTRFVGSCKINGWGKCRS